MTSKHEVKKKRVKAERKEVFTCSDCHKKFFMKKYYNMHLRKVHGQVIVIGRPATLKNRLAQA